MTSSLVIEICNIDAIERHPNANRLAIATIKGWKTCIGYDPETKTADFKPGDSAVYFPPDSILPPELAEKLNVVNYCSTLPKNYDETTPPGYRVKAARLRGFASYGFASRLESVGLAGQVELGADVAEILGVTKYVPPVKANAGDAEPDYPAFHKYSSIENIGNFPTLIPEGELVVISEKLHGSNNRVGIVRNKAGDWEFMCGSNEIRRKEFDSKGNRSSHWNLLTDEIRTMLIQIVGILGAGQSVIIFNELFGPGIQDMHYGQEKQSNRVFDIAVDHVYLDHDVTEDLCEQFNVHMVPILYEGPFSPTVVQKFTDGPTMIANIAEGKKKFTGREGVVIKTVKEQISPLTNGRMILKSISVDYLARKGGTDNE